MESIENPEVTTPSSPAEKNKSNNNRMVNDLFNEAEMSLEIWPPYCNPTYIMPEKIDVKVNVAGEYYIFPVTILKAESNSKKYLGGYRNKVTGQTYHHGSSQTPVDPNKKNSVKGRVVNTEKLRSRETQTYEVRTLSVQPYRESGTQMERIDLTIDTKRDKIIISRDYFTADALLALKKVKVVEIQRYWRGYMARCRAHQIKQRNIDFKMQQEEERYHNLPS